MAAMLVVMFVFSDGSIRIGESQTWQVLKWVGGVSFAAIIPVTLVLEQLGHERFVRGCMALLLSAPLWAWAGCDAAHWLNRLLDEPEGQWQTAAITAKSQSKGRGTAYWLEGRLEPSGRRVMVPVDLATFNVTPAGAHLSIKVHAGAFGWPWGSSWRPASS